MKPVVGKGERLVNNSYLAIVKSRKADGVETDSCVPRYFSLLFDFFQQVFPINLTIER